MSGADGEVLVVNIENDIGNDKTPCIGMKFDSEEEAYTFYNNYGMKVGFSIRKDYCHKSKKDGLINNRKFVCSKEGERGVDKREHSIKKHRAQTRTNCLANMQIILNCKIGKYVVTKWNDDHNHHLHLPECTHMMPSQRRVSAAQGINVEMAEKSGISLKASYELLSKQAGGRESLGFTRLDQKNYLRLKRQHDMVYGEAGSLLEYFQTQAAANPSFYYAFQLDVEEQITNIFWADPKMIIDYGHFGDVVTFGTTFRTNKEYRLLAIFVGLNHFRQTVIFGAALMYDETTPSFEWLFETFLHAMSGKKPLTIFTDEDQAMANAISNLMPKSTTYHALCSWHLMQNGLKHLANFFKEGTDFNRDFKACMYGCDSESELVKAWELLLDNYALRDNSWMAKTWLLREKWARAYLKRTFTTGVRSTQLSESVNSELKRYLQPDHNIPRFLHHFNRFVHDKRYKALEAIYNIREKQPELKMKTPILVQAGDTYTPTILKLFQDELEKSMSYIVKHCHESGVECEYVVSFYGDEKESFVTFNSLEKTVSCSCRNFEMIGILCRHALKVFHKRDIMQIPDTYILKRWRRDARDSFTADACIIVDEEDPKLVASSRYRQLCPRLIQLATRCSTDEKAYQLVLQATIELFKQVTQMCNSENDFSVGSQEDPRVKGTSPINPNLTRIKGFKKKEAGYKGWRRLRPWHEKAPKGGKKKSQTPKLSGMRKNTTVAELPRRTNIQNECHEEPRVTSHDFEMPQQPWMSEDHYSPCPPSASSPHPLIFPQYSQGMIVHPTIDIGPNFLSDNFYDFLGGSGV